MLVLSNTDFSQILKENKLDSSSSYLAYNKIPKEDIQPYSLRTYIPLFQKEGSSIKVRYNMDDPQMEIPLSGKIHNFPFSLEASSSKGIYVFTNKAGLSKFLDSYGRDPGDSNFYYNLKTQSKKDLDKLTNQTKKSLESYISKYDFMLTNSTFTLASEKEQLRNENLLNLGIQCIFLVIALSNAYNSFSGNMRSRRKDFHILSSLGMTDQQMEKMVSLEGRSILLKTISLYILVFSAYLLLFTHKHHWVYSPLQYLERINYIPILLLFILLALGVQGAIKAGKKEIFINESIRDLD